MNGDEIRMKHQIIICPLMGKEIDDGLCFDIHMVSEGLAPERTIPKEAREVLDYQKICLSCENHKE